MSELPAGQPTPLKGQDQSVDPSIPARTTYQEDLTTASQRKVNLIWEYTQAVIAILVIVANMIVGTAKGLGYGAAGEYPIILSSSLFLIVGFYFSRTNHQAIGGIGPKSNEQAEYKGR